MLLIEKIKTNTDKNKNKKHSTNPLCEIKYHDLN